MLSLPMEGTCSYNGWTFSSAMETVGFSAKPQLDVAGRTNIYVVYSITLKDTIQTDYPATTDALVQKARVALTQNACLFTYTNKGIGNNFIINTKPIYDVVWGPKVQLLDFKKRAGAYAWDYTWKCDIALPECDAASKNYLILELGFKVGFSIDRSGYTSRTISGLLRVPQTRFAPGQRDLKYTADDWRNLVFPLPMKGFRRTNSKFDLDESKCRLDFSITDEEMPPNIPPPDCIEAKMSHRIQNKDPFNMQMFTETFEATYEVKKGTNPSVMLDEFVKAVRSRAAKAADKIAQFPVSFTISEPEVYGKSIAQFSLTLLTNGFAKPQPLYSGQLWTPVPDATWDLWETSMEGGIFDPHSYAQLHFDPRDDAIVDLCQNNPPPKPGGAPKVINNELPKPTQSGLRQQSRTISQLLQLPTPEPANTWLKYVNGLQYINASADIFHYPLPQQAIASTLSSTGPGGQGFAGTLVSSLGVPPAGTGATTAAPASGVASNFGATSPYTPGPPGGLPAAAQPAIRQRRGIHARIVLMQGYAVRALYPITPPRLVSVGGIKANRSDFGNEYGFWQTYFGDFGAPIYMASWSFRYILLVPPTSPIWPPPNATMPATFDNVPKSPG